mmetsp:Transcript_15978/g.30002  ORF Transcript_15978/g.30002 Transcript_15978/m.30002 type:complete len:224 (-) Transcript_15978:404-1075(-)|eukprot:CAMPEP_0114435144 /NCGR_PEP_ID=MMETSP0103-20121206/12659_1 /TAXON_ID=37642 ORGANISM="Paraphysomonas imperforata, Strain PA2" /NCGR_SAMPLE_ID=MMETSP0103 /ASSEMBLY_ACC=CAM_ASM_000201 /LENGTH=223 /DNA_ID=CAMNT_0001605121 /DNA_START=160 /DNA_END=831 /DNA_ORIENTATION=-
MSALYKDFMARERGGGGRSRSLVQSAKSKSKSQSARDLHHQQLPKKKHILQNSKSMPAPTVAAQSLDERLMALPVQLAHLSSSGPPQLMSRSDAMKWLAGQEGHSEHQDSPPSSITEPELDPGPDSTPSQVLGANFPTESLGYNKILSPQDVSQNKKIYDIYISGGTHGKLGGGVPVKSKQIMSYKSIKSATSAHGSNGSSQLPETLWSDFSRHMDAQLEAGR